MYLARGPPMSIIAVFTLTGSCRHARHDRAQKLRHMILLRVAGCYVISGIFV